MALPSAAPKPTNTWPSCATPWAKAATWTLPAKTPVVYGGDLNMVGPGWAMHTLLTGDIHDETATVRTSPRIGTARCLRELTCLQTDRAMDYTWRNDYSEWGAGKLDYILVQDGVVEVLRDFSVETSSMTRRAPRPLWFGSRGRPRGQRPLHRGGRPQEAGPPAAASPSSSRKAADQRCPTWKTRLMLNPK